jgi:putative oxidoreductase
MSKFIQQVTTIYPSARSFHLGMLVFRILLSLEMMIVHGFKKIGIGVDEAEQVPNPLDLPVELNQLLALSANLFFPLFIIAGLLTRLAVLPVLAVTLTGYFLLHWHDALWIKDVPFMYSISFLLLLVLGPGKYSADYLIHKRFSL